MARRRTSFALDEGAVRARFLEIDVLAEPLGTVTELRAPANAIREFRHPGEFFLVGGEVGQLVSIGLENGRERAARRIVVRRAGLASVSHRM